MGFSPENSKRTVSSPFGCRGCLERRVNSARAGGGFARALLKARGTAVCVTLHAAGRKLQGGGVQEDALTSGKTCSERRVRTKGQPGGPPGGVFESSWGLEKKLQGETEARKVRSVISPFLLFPLSFPTFLSLLKTMQVLSRHPF